VVPGDVAAGVEIADVDDSLGRDGVQPPTSTTAAIAAELNRFREAAARFTEDAGAPP
jgi:hypothetical protein